MKRNKAMIWLFAMALALGIGIFSMPQPVNAQTDKCPKVNQQENDDKDDDEKLSPDDTKKVKIAMAEARTIALGRVAGTVIEEELEKEKNRLQYAFDICDGNGKIWDVEIDAITGDVLQAAEDDDDGKEDGTTAAKKKNIFIRTAGKVKKNIAKVF
jgi:peptidase YpeB-like protein